MNMKLKKENVEDVVFLSEQGYEVIEIAEKLGVSKTTIQRFKKKHGVTFDEDLALFNRNKRKWKGYVFDKVTVLELDSFVRYSPGHIKYKARCLCHCGKEFVTFLRDLQRGHTKSCGCSRNKSMENHPCWKGIGKVPKTFWNRIPTAAKLRGHEVTIDHKYVADLFDSQEGKCAITNLPLSFDESGKATASLDRINNDRGYVSGNVHWVHRDINQMKFKYSMDRFIELCALVTENNSPGV